MVKRKNDKEITDKDLIGSIPKVIDFDPFGGIDIESITGKNKKKKPTVELRNKPNSELLTEPLNDSVNKPNSELLTEPLNDPVDKPNSKRLTEPLNDPVDKPNSKRLTEPLNDSVDKPNSKRLTEPLNNPVNKPNSELLTEPLNDSVNKLEQVYYYQNLNDPIFWINDNYANVLTYLINKTDKIGNNSSIGKSLNLSVSTIKRAILKLEELDFIKRSEKPFIKGKIRGFSYSINKTICRKFMKLRGKYLLKNIAVISKRI